MFWYNMNPGNHHHSQDNEHFHHSQMFPYISFYNLSPPISLPLPSSSGNHWCAFFFFNLDNCFAFRILYKLNLIICALIAWHLSLCSYFGMHPYCMCINSLFFRFFWSLRFSPLFNMLKFVYPLPIEGGLTCFQFLVIVHEVALNIMHKPVYFHFSWVNTSERRD